MPGEHRGFIAGLVLAAGTSTRMGRNKLLLEVGGEALVHRAARCAWEAGLDPVIVVLGHEAIPVMARLQDLPCVPVVNPDYAQGIQSSLRAGLAVVPAAASAALVLLADMPLVDAGMIAAVMDRYRSGPISVVVSRYGGVTAPPTLYDRSLLGELAAAGGPGCGRQVVRRHGDDAAFIDWPVETLTDMDVPDDVERVHALVESLEGHRRAR
jgi:molybdenum cofactor cytidylyltransferase